MDSSLGLNIFTLLFLSGTFLAAMVAGLGGFAFGIVAAAVWLYILTPLQTATLITHGVMFSIRYCVTASSAANANGYDRVL